MPGTEKRRRGSWREEDDMVVLGSGFEFELVGEPGWRALLRM